MVCGQNICHHVAALRDSRYFDMLYVLNNLNFYLLTQIHDQGGGGGVGGSARKIFASMSLHY